MLGNTTRVPERERALERELGKWGTTEGSPVCVKGNKRRGQGYLKSQQRERERERKKEREWGESWEGGVKQGHAGKRRSCSGNKQVQNHSKAQGKWEKQNNGPQQCVRHCTGVHWGKGRHGNVEGQWGSWGKVCSNAIHAGGKKWVGRQACIQMS